MKKAIVTGISGQDGAYLAKILLDKGYKVYGGLRRTSTSNLWRLDRLGITNDIELISFELLEQSNIFKMIQKIQPDEFYNLAAQSFVGVSFEQPMYTAHASGLSVLSILDAIKSVSPHTKFYQASTSEMFGKVHEVPQKETTPFHPRSPYGVAKLYAHWITKNYRESYDMFASSGILFNHESPFRGEEFVTRKITNSLVKIHKGQQEKLTLGNLDAKRDWGFAGDYCQGIHKILQHNIADDFILSTGKTHSVRDFIEKACLVIDTEVRWEGTGVETKGFNSKTNKLIIDISEDFYRPCEVDHLLGDSTKAREELNWTPEVSFEGLVTMMMEEELKYL
ncbi:GDP-mannose 4,6-dehydratase [Halobacteriovorax marinus]|uniref:GDP-mannose 4,6-dehydratase n=1 Tax=Halobacteriovorax marinus TaxID=97084 RepID=A0A1Y5FBC2_9BACT|nr:GDP-mannose 4,6-dehydratase [Halobacteriovorax marinus]